MELALSTSLVHPCYGRVSDPILALFANGEQGAYYDPSDSSTVFQDSQGKTPALADDPVGLVLDKRKGLELGPELVTNGTFDADTGGWSPRNAVLSSVDGQLVVESTSVSGRAIQSFATVVGKWYRASVTVVGGTGFKLVRLGTSDGNPIYLNTQGEVGTKSVIFLATTTTTYWSLYSGDTVGLTGIFDNATVRELPGNHATQSMAAARPIRRTDGTHWWLEFDGVDDAMATFAIDFTATDKVSTGLAIRTLTSSPGVLLEISPNTGANFGAFYVAQNDGAPYTSASHGTGAFGGANVARVFGDAAINTTNVVTSQHDLGANLTTIRKNAVGGTTVTTALGGNFGNYALNFGARNGGATFMSKALIYRAFVRGALTQSADLTAIETELAAAAGIAL